MNVLPLTRSACLWEICRRSRQASKLFRQIKSLYRMSFGSDDDELYTSGTLCPLRLKWCDVSCDLTLTEWAFCQFVERSLPVVNDPRLISIERLTGQIRAQLPPAVLLSSFPHHFIKFFFFFFSISFIHIFTTKTTCRKRWWKATSACSAPPLCCHLAVCLIHSKDLVFLVAISLASWWWVIQ